MKAVKKVGINHNSARKHLLKLDRFAFIFFVTVKKSNSRLIYITEKGKQLKRLLD